MKKFLQYGLLCCLLMCLAACAKNKILNNFISLWHRDKIPYGTYYAYENLSYIFQNAKIHSGRSFPEIDHEDVGDSCRALIILSRRFFPEEEDLHNLVRFAASGNQVFISAMYFNDTLFDFLNLKIRSDDTIESDTAAWSLLNPVSGEWDRYAYPGYEVSSWFDSLDTSRCQVLGKNAMGKPDFIRVTYDHGGAIFIHLDPMVFTNFFLLHGGNHTYYDIAFSYMAQKTKEVEWSDFFRYQRQEEFSSLGFIMNNRSLRWAFWITLSLFGILALTEFKRKQRPIPEIAPPRNASEEFVRTIGRLYFQQKNNPNLAAKMVAAFLEHIRTQYNLPTSRLNDELALKLAGRTGRPLNDIRRMMELIHQSRMDPDFTDRDLMELHLLINQFNTTPI